MPLINLCPIHSIGQDNERDSFFTNNNIIVIRFAEEQVINYSEACIEFLKRFLFFIENASELRIIDGLFFRYRIPRWSKEEAESMIKENYRDKYLQ